MNLQQTNHLLTMNRLKMSLQMKIVTVIHLEHLEWLWGLRGWTLVLLVSQFYEHVSRAIDMLNSYSHSADDSLNWAFS